MYGNFQYEKNSFNFYFIYWGEVVYNFLFYIIFFVFMLLLYRVEVITC